MSDDPIISPRSAERLLRAARAAQMLSGTLWEALHEELSDPRGQRAAELSRRLGDVAATVGLLVRAEASPSPVQERTDVARSQSLATRTIRDEPPAPGGGSGRREPPEPHESSASREPPVPRGSSAAWESPPRKLSAESQVISQAVLVDELAPDAPPAQGPSASPDRQARALREIEIRDERGEELRRERGASEEDRARASVDAIARRLERYERDRVPFAVLVVELADVERLRHAELPGEVSRLTGLVETALAGELRPADSLTRESPGRYWLLAPETDANSSRALAERLASAVRGAASHRSAPLEVAVGIAVCPRDGSRAAALAAHAEIGLYAARAAGRPLA